MSTGAIVNTSRYAFYKQNKLARHGKVHMTYQTWCDTYTTILGRTISGRVNGVRWSRPITGIFMSVLLLSMLAACTPSDLLTVRCEQVAERAVSDRAATEQIEEFTGNCVWADGTVCEMRQVARGDCSPSDTNTDGANTATTSPLPVPDGAPLPSMAMLVPPPQTLEELVSPHAALIFIGEVGPAEQYLDLYGYNERGQVTATVVDPLNTRDYLVAIAYITGGDRQSVMEDPSLTDIHNIPATDLRLHVEEVLRDDGTIAAGEPVILRIVGFATEELAASEIMQNSAFPLSYTGDRHLFVLGRNPDGTYGLTYGPWSRLIIDGEILRVSNPERQPLIFEGQDEPVTLEEFIQAVNSADD